MFEKFSFALANRILLSSNETDTDTDGLEIIAYHSLKHKQEPENTDPCVHIFLIKNIFFRPKT